MSSGSKLVPANHFTVFVPSYNAEKWVNNNLSSIFGQNYDNYDLFYVDDSSADGTYEECLKYFKTAKFNGKNKKIVKNSFNKGKMYNICAAMEEFREDTIVVIVDGDDWLHDENVLSKLNDYYTDDVWMTNGSYVIVPHDVVVTPKTSSEYWEGNIRTKSWEFSHLGTFRKRLFEKIKRKDFMNKQGEYFNTSSDQAIMWPIAEMSGPEHAKSINDVLYCYNRSNPLADDIVNRKDQLDSEKDIRSRKSYSRLEHL